MVRVCLVGCGRIARRHLEAMKGLGHLVRLSATVDLDAARARESARKYGADGFFTEPLEAARSPDVEAAVICLPHDALTETSALFLKHGKHVLAEKPMGVDASRLEDAVELSEANSLVFQPGYVTRFMASFSELKRRLDAGRLGEVRHILSANYRYIEKPATPWWSSRRKAGGFYLPIFSSHVLDRTMWLTGGGPSSVCAVLRSLSPAFEGESDGVAVLSFRGDMSAIINFSATACGKPVRMELVVTTEATVEITRQSMTVDGEPVELNEVDPFAEQLKEFCAAVGEGRRSVPDARDGLTALKLLAALQTSSRENRVVVFE